MYLLWFLVLQKALVMSIVYACSGMHGAQKLDYMMFSKLLVLIIVVILKNQESMFMRHVRIISGDLR